MKLGLLGFPIDHSKSPELYKRILGEKLISYNLYSFQNSHDIPRIDFFKERLDGLSITSPYKRHFFHQAIIDSDLVIQIGAINTIRFKHGKVFATNTDVHAVREQLQHYKNSFGDLMILLLGDGVMSDVVKLLSSQMNIPLKQFSRKLNGDISRLNLAPYGFSGIQNIVINSCSRDFNFDGIFSGDEVFWDFNYDHFFHLNKISKMVKSYQDGRLMLEAQALQAIKFWAN